MTERKEVESTWTGLERVLWRRAPLAFAACVVVMILSLPLFPSQDGPVHLYFVDVLRSLLTHTGPYDQHFEIKKYVTPYMLEYYSLLALETVFPPLLSEKLLICGYVLTFILSFRYLVGSVTEDPNPWTMAGAPFCLNLYVGMGFLNYAFGTALVLLLSSCWVRWLKRLTPRRITLLLGGVVLILLTHPMPAAMFLAFAGLHVAVSFTYEWIGCPSALSAVFRTHRRPIGVIAVMGLVAAVWVFQFLGNSHPAGGSPVAAPANWLLNGSRALKFWGLAIVTGAAYRAILMALTASVGVTLLIALWNRRGRIGMAAASMAGMVVICFIASCVSVPVFNGSAFFQERFSIYWVMFLLSLSAAVKPPRWSATAVGVLALGATIAVTSFQWNYLSRAARGLNSALNAPPVKPGSLGLIISEKRDPARVVSRDFLIWGGLRSDAFVHGSAHFFRNSKAILTNAPWMDLDIIMFRPKQAYPWTYSEAQYAPQKVLDTLDRQGTAPLDFVVRLNDGPITRETIERLHFRSFHSVPQIAFYF